MKTELQACEEIPIALEMIGGSGFAGCPWLFQSQILDAKIFIGPQIIKKMEQ